jgi:hypothetical protein
MSTAASWTVDRGEHEVRKELVGGPNAGDCDGRRERRDVLCAEFNS